MHYFRQCVDITTPPLLSLLKQNLQVIFTHLGEGKLFSNLSSTVRTILEYIYFF